MCPLLFAANRLVQSTSTCSWVSPPCVHEGGSFPPAFMLVGSSPCVHAGGSLLCACRWCLSPVYKPIGAFPLHACWYVPLPCVHAGWSSPAVCCWVWQMVQGLKTHLCLSFLSLQTGWFSVPSVPVSLLCVYLLVLPLFVFCGQVGTESYLFLWVCCGCTYWFLNELAGASPVCAFWWVRPPCVLIGGCFHRASKLTHFLLFCFL